MKLSILQSSLSLERLNPYLNYVQQKTLDDVEGKTVELYVWHSKISAAFLDLAQYYEVALRNAILKAIEDKYPTYSIQDRAFIRSIPKNSQKELKCLIKEMRDDVIKSERVKSGKSINDIEDKDVVLNNGKIVAGLNFYFWETILKYMFCVNDSGNNDSFPLLYRHKALFSQTATDEEFKKIVNITNKFRHKIRNRICHHEPIYKNNLDEIYKEVMWCINQISPNLHELLVEELDIAYLLEKRPI